MDEYLEKLLSQIRCKKARPYISDEVKGHIEDQIAQNISEGMDTQEAEKRAVADMGDPVEVGISLDRIHKPQLAWRLLVLVGVLSVLGIFLQQSILNKIGTGNVESYMQQANQLTMIGFVSSVVFGFIIMCGIYFIDYTLVARYAKVIGLCIIGLGILSMTGFFGTDINGMHFYVGFGMFRISVASLMMYYIPIYGAILYKYREGGMISLLKTIVWLIVPVLLTFRVPNLMAASVMTISMLIQLTTAILKGWFKVPVKRTVVMIWTVFLVLPIVMLYVMFVLHMLATYQEARIQAFLSASGEGYYMTGMLRSFSKNIAFLGSSGNDVIGRIPNINSDYIFSYIINSYGSMAGILVIAILAALVVFVFSACIKQKNELGLVMGFGCGMVLALNTALNLLCATGVIPPASSFLPFFSVGRSNIILCYALIGIIMSIYRYKDVYPKHTKTSYVLFQKNFTINF